MIRETLKKIDLDAQLCVKSVRTTRVIRGLSELFWKILEVVSEVQISLGVLVAKNDGVKSRKTVYLIGLLLLLLFAVMFPDRIPSILSSSHIDTMTVSERTHGLVKAVKKLLPAF